MLSTFIQNSEQLKQWVSLCMHKFVCDVYVQTFSWTESWFISNSDTKMYSKFMEKCRNYRNHTYLLLWVVLWMCETKFYTFHKSNDIHRSVIWLCIKSVWNGFKDGTLGIARESCCTCSKVRACLQKASYVRQKIVPKSLIKRCFECVLCKITNLGHMVTHLAYLIHSH